jgi:hypothetical protein
MRRSVITVLFANIIRMINSRRMRLARHVSRMGRREIYIRVWWEIQKERDH